VILLEGSPVVENLPIWAWLLGLLVTSVIGPALVAKVNNRKIRAEAASTRDDVAEIRNQVANTHDSNLRDDLDAKFEEMGSKFAAVQSGLEGVREDLGGIHSETRDLRKDVAGIRTDARQDRRSIAELRAEVGEQIKQGLENHTERCALLTKKETP